VKFQQIHYFSLSGEERCRGLKFLPIRLSSTEGVCGVALLALAAKPKAQSIASHTTSALYETSLLTFKIPIDNKWTEKKLKKTEIDQTTKQEGNLTDLVLSNNVIQLLRDMNRNLEGRLDKIEAVMTSQAKKIDHLQACVDKLS